MAQQIASSFLSAAIGRVICRLRAQVVEPELLDVLGELGLAFRSGFPGLVELRAQRRRPLQLPGGGWPKGTLVDLLVQQPGVGEMRLLAPALSAVSKRKVVLLQPPHAPQALALAALGIPPDSALWLHADRTADVMWAAEQVLRSASCGALLFWPGQSSSSARQQHVRADSLRRLHLAAQQGETLFFIMRLLGAEVDASPAPLCLAIRPVPGGINIGFVKRHGPQRAELLFLPMQITPRPFSKPQRHIVPQRLKEVTVAEIPDLA